MCEHVELILRVGKNRCVGGRVHGEFFRKYCTAPAPGPYSPSASAYSILRSTRARQSASAGREARNGPRSRNRGADSRCRAHLATSLSNLVRTAWLARPRALTRHALSPLVVGYHDESHSSCPPVSVYSDRAVRARRAAVSCAILSIMLGNTAPQATDGAGGGLSDTPGSVVWRGARRFRARNSKLIRHSSPNVWIRLCLGGDRVLHAHG